MNPDSPTQLVRALAAAGVRVPSTRFSVLREIDHPAIPPLLEYKELSRLHAAHGWAWLDAWVRGGRFRPEYVVGGVVSGRWASRGGGALQIPRVLRRAVVADPGWVLVVADAAQLEPRVLAALAGDRAFAEAAAGGDLYEGLASVFGGDRNTGQEGAAVRHVRRGRAARPASCSPCCGGASPPRPATWRPRRGPARKAGWSDPCSAGPARRRRPRGAPSPRSPATPRPSGTPGPGRASRARGRFTRNFVVQASAADWALVLLAALRRRLAALGEARGRPLGPAGAAPGVLPA